MSWNHWLQACLGWLSNLDLSRTLPVCGCQGECFGTNIEIICMMGRSRSGVLLLEPFVNLLRSICGWMCASPAIPASVFQRWGYRLHGHVWLLDMLPGDLNSGRHHAHVADTLPTEPSPGAPLFV